MAEVVVISDTDSESNCRVISPLTALKSRSIKPSSTKRNVKRLSKDTKQPRNQTKLDNFFKTLTIKSNKSRNSPTKVDISLRETFVDHGDFGTSDDKGEESSQSTKDVKLSPLKPSRAVKRSAVKGLSPQAKLASRPKPKITDLKGDELWRAVVAQRKKPTKSLTSAFEELENESNRKSPIAVDFEDLLMTKQVVHSFPNDSKKLQELNEIKNNVVDETERILTSYKEKIPEVIPDEPVLESSPLFRPKQRITIKKKRKDTDIDFVTSSEVVTSTQCVRSSTPTKTSTQVQISQISNRSLTNGSLDLFSDNSLLSSEKEEGAPALCDEYGRHTVVDCSVGDMNTILLLRNTQGESRTCELQGFWADTQLKAGAVVNVLGEFDSNGYICIDMKQDNMLVVHPDFLVSGSVIASATTCVRRSVLNNRYKGYDAGNKYMLFGSILHEVFQKVLISDIRDQVEMRKLAESIAHTSSYAHDMYAINMTEKSLVDGIVEYIPPMISFLNKHVDKKSNTGQGAINIGGIRDIEETVWSPRFGMKGKIDVTVDCKVRDQPSHVVPLELKTGRPSYSAEHKGQVTMYSMMLAEKEQGYVTTSKLKPGLLVYLKDGSMQEVKQAGAAIKGLVNLRNELCQGLLLGISKHPSGDESNKGSEYTVDALPEPINQSRTCGYCPHQITCSLHQKVFDDYKPYPGHIMEKLVPETLEHLTPSHLEYFAKWSKLLLIESSMEAKWKTIRNLWTKPVKQRSSSGHCLTGLTVTDITEGISGRYTITLTTPPIPTTNKLSAGDMVMISEPDTKVVLVSTGSLIELGHRSVKLLLDRAKLRSLVIEKRCPQFDEFLDDECEDKVEKIIADLNTNQKLAVTQSLLAKDYLLIKGYPGTGKTSTIVTLVETLRAQGLSVLVTSYTHSAVDNILLKLKQRNIEFIRLGRGNRIHPDIVPHSSEYLTRELKTVDQISGFYSGFHVAGTTCLGISHAMLCQRRFDVCIVDEASQILQPISLGPLFYASRFILVGDNQQLPPLIKSNDAKSLGMQETLLDLLEGVDNSACVELTQQYRMNSEIMRLSNQLIYNNKLCCGTELVKTSTISPSVDDCDSVSSSRAWLERLISGSLSDSLILLNTAACGYTPTKKTSIHSNTEARLVHDVCQALIKIGVEGNSIGVITPYQAQVQLLRSTVNIADIEVNTVDQYQGRDKSVIVISFARTTSTPSQSGQEGILSDMRRLNVAITRAKHKMILIGNIGILQSYTPVKSLMGILRDDQIIHLPLYVNM